MVRLPHLSLTPLLLGLALIAAGYLGITTVRYVVRNYQAHQEERALGNELRQLDEDRAQLSATRDYLKSDEYINYIARRILGLVRPGETLVVVAGNEPAATATPASQRAEPWWKQLFIDPTPVAPLPRLP